MSAQYEGICSEIADKIKKINDIIPDDFACWHVRIRQILEKIESANENFYSSDIRKEIQLEVNSVFSLRALGDIYWPDMPPTQEWWRRLSEVCKISNLL